MNTVPSCATPPPSGPGPGVDIFERLSSSEPPSLSGSPAHHARWASPAATLMVETEWDGKEVTLADGYVKFRDNKRWKQRWGVLTKLSPAADCLHLQLYRDCKDRYKQGQTKASLSLQHFLGLESGFTLDKESNTVAIICQDLTVVLAFDTRERLIQWQVKIGTHLGEDQQFLIQVSSAPPKSKVATGPARLHVQDYKFCLTAGVPPRLLGVWEIGHLRRYGVVDGKFCFEGGSRCGPRGEGLHVLGCGQASEIQQALQLASQGKLATRRRPIARKMSAMDSPRKAIHSRTDPRASDLSCADSLLGAESLLGRSLCEAAQHHGSATMEDLTGGRRSPWSSAESSEMLDSCSDVTSVIAVGDLENRSMERCASCISKLGAVSVKTSFSPAWTMEQHSQSASLAQDRASLSSGSSGGSSATDWYDRPRAVLPPSVPPKSPRHVPRCQCCPPERPPKPTSPKKAAACPRPGHAQPLQPQQEEHNYDVPRNFMHTRVPLQERHSSLDYYDTPKKLREAIEYSNYDTPPTAKSIRSVCGCSTLPTPRRSENMQQMAGRHHEMAPNVGHDYLDRPQHLRKELPRAHCVSDGSSLDDCTGLPYVWRGDKRNLQVAARMASDVASGNCPCQRVMCWSLPCRRGSGAEDTGIPIHKVRLNGEGRMPVRDPSGQLAVLYATVDKTKKKPRPPPSPNYVNIGEFPPQANYANLDFAQSLENYENARDILHRAGITKEEVLDLCQKCGHPPEQYLMMEPRKPLHHGIPGYLTMSPANLGRASSIPALTTRQPPIPGEVTHNEMRQQSAMLQRKRSSSADASRFLSDEEEVPADQSSQQLQSESTSTLSDCTQINPMDITDSDISAREVEGEMKERLATLPRSTLEELKDRPVAVHIRRSSSVPCKTGHNRDSSSSNDSGVSAGSPHFPDLDTRPVCLHASLPRRCRSSDPLKDVARVQASVPAKSSSAEAEVPISVQPTKGNNTTNGEASTVGAPPDSHSTSSGTSDMSDYIETLSLSSHSSSDINDSLRLNGRQATTTLRPRSGREYHNRAFIETDLKVTERVVVTASLRGLAHFPGSVDKCYPGVDKCESPSPGYMSGSPGQEREDSGQPR